MSQQLTHHAIPESCQAPSVRDAPLVVLLRPRDANIDNIKDGIQRHEDCRLQMASNSSVAYFRAPDESSLLIESNLTSQSTAKRRHMFCIE